MPPTLSRQSSSSSFSPGTGTGLSSSGGTHSDYGVALDEMDMEGIELPPLPLENRRSPSSSRARSASLELRSRAPSLGRGSGDPFDTSSAAGSAAVKLQQPPSSSSFVVKKEEKDDKLLNVNVLLGRDAKASVTELQVFPQVDNQRMPPKFVRSTLFPHDKDMTTIPKNEFLAQSHKAQPTPVPKMKDDELAKMPELVIPCSAGLFTGRISITSDGYSRGKLVCSCCCMPQDLS